MSPKEINDNIRRLMAAVKASRPRLTDEDLANLSSLDQCYPVTVWSGGYPRPDALDEDNRFGVFTTSGNPTLD